MGKAGAKITGQSQGSFFGGRSYSISEIMAAGGATAFANKKGKKPQHVTERIKSFPKEAFLTNEEAENALEILKNQ